MGNRASLNRLLRERSKTETQAWIREHFEQLPERDPATIAAEDAEIARRRNAFPLH